MERVVTSSRVSLGLRPGFTGYDYKQGGLGFKTVRKIWMKRADMRDGRTVVEELQTPQPHQIIWDCEPGLITQHHALVDEWENIPLKILWKACGAIILE